MIYAKLKNGVVVNLLCLSDQNAHEFSDVVKVDGQSVAIGDIYDGEKFRRLGAETLAEIETYKEALNTVGVQTEEVTDDAE